ncbi:hypothetical protein BDQ17DRAFT_339886 [Cyathus striatus]|nr:hypothetical protein BDQ17DRAFT_339886 [Cyathus striatus]
MTNYQLNPKRRDIRPMPPTPLLSYRISNYLTNPIDPTKHVLPSTRARRVYFRDLRESHPAIVSVAVIRCLAQVRAYLSLTYRDWV